ncbi:beta-arrestin [Paragonimus westermani]|uniref:Beta-arrestin n=1 Tax=Paragonimus westermani TaxID=34504 RepID=A0A5J4NA90_9TREM|nr:beta-arrestin [Paragonimus westermani]
MLTKRSVYKKNSPNNKVAVYLSARDIFDDMQTVDPIDGVVTMEDSAAKDNKLFARIRCTFRYGEQALDDIFSGVTFYKEFLIETQQIHPNEEKDKFTCSEIQVYVGKSITSPISKRNCISMIIRRLTIAIPEPNSLPFKKEILKNFHIHCGFLKITTVLPKEIFYHGETIPVLLKIENSSSNTVRRMKLQVIQVIEMTIFKQNVTRTVVSEVESDDGFPVNPNSRDWEHTFTIRPSLQDALQKDGLALDGKLKHEDTTLASSTLIKDFRKKDMMALVIHYLIRVKIFTGFGGRDVEADIPVILTHKRGTQEIVKAETVGDLIIEKFKRNKSKLVDPDEDV